MKSYMLRFISCLLLLIFNSALAAETSAEPKIGLVLSGGGARGAAHIGVLKVLEEHNIQVDYIAGTSMGAIVGGFYASGMTAIEIEQAITEKDWKTLFQDRPPRADRSFRRKRDDDGFLVEFDVGVDKEGLIFPQGLVQGQNLEITLKRFLLPVATTTDFDQLPIPFRAIATDLETGEAIPIKSGDLARAIRASMSLPGIFKPVKYDNRLLVDGGVANNLPVQIARDMGADILIVVDVGFPLKEAEELDSALAVTRQMLTIMINGRAREQLSNLQTQDILISPDLGDLDSQDFQRLDDAIKIGEQTAQQLTNSLSTLSISEQAYSDHRQKLQQRRKELPVINRIVIENESRLSPNVIKERLSDLTGKILDVDQLEKDISNVYGFDTFETVNYSLTENVSGTDLLIRGKEKSWGPNYLQFGVNLEDDFAGTSDYNLAARYTRTEINRLGGEFRTEIQIGENPKIFAEFYQPLDYASRWFINPSIKFGRSNTVLFSGEHRIAQFREKETELSIAGGRQFGNWGEFRLAINHSINDSSIRIGNPLFGNSTGDTTSLSAIFAYDTIDDLAIPRSGLSLSFGWLGVRESLGSDVDFDIAQLFILKPWTQGRHTLTSFLNLNGVVDDPTNGIDAFSLGGLFNLSGYTPGELVGQYGGLSGLFYYYRLGDTKLPAFDVPVYVGASLEAGYVRKRGSESRQHNDLLMAGSVYIVFDTILGPLYLAYGAAEHDRRSAYLFLGQTF